MEVLKTLVFLILISIPLTLGGLVVVGGADGEFSEERILRIDRRPTEVFTWLVSSDLREEWKKGLKKSNAGRGNTMKVGDSFLETYTYDGPSEERKLEITHYEYGRSFGYRTTIQGVPFSVVYEVGAHHTGRHTLLTMRYQAQWDGTWNHIIEPILSTQLRTAVDEDLKNLQLKVETSQPMVF